MLTKMSQIKLKSHCHPKNQVELKLNEKVHSTDANTKVMEMLELSEKDYRVTIIKMPELAITNTLAQVKK